MTFLLIKIKIIVIIQNGCFRCAESDTETLVTAATPGSDSDTLINFPSPTSSVATLVSIHSFCSAYKCRAHTYQRIAARSVYFLIRTNTCMFFLLCTKVSFSILVLADSFSCSSSTKVNFHFVLQGKNSYKYIRCKISQ